MPMTLISRTTLTTSAASVTFSSIPQTFQTLKLVYSGRVSDTNTDLVIEINGTTTGFSWRRLIGVGNSVLSQSNTTNAAGQADPSSATANTFSSTEIQFPKIGRAHV